MAALKVFLSSVAVGFRPIRAQLSGSLRTAGFEVLGMEHFGAQPEPPIEVCLREVRRADIVVLVAGPRYGTLLPQGISYTQAEFREARGLGIPVHAFRVPDEDGLAQEELDRLAAFRTEIGTAATYDSLTPGESFDLLPGKVLAALIKARDLGVVGRSYKLFQKFDRFFATQLKSRSAFSHEGDYIGRAAELRTISDFVTSSDAPLLLLSAAGGTGKSRILLEVAKRVSVSGGPPVLFADPGAQWSAEDIHRLPSVPFILVFDDAHRRSDLDRLISACYAQNDHGRYIVSFRPSAIRLVQSLLTRTIGLPLPAAIELAPLSADDAQALARYHLGPTLEQYAERLVSVAARNPLVISVGGRCIARHRVTPEVLGGSPEEFTQAVLDRLLEDPELAQHDAPTRESILRVLSAIGPAPTESTALLDVLASHVGIPEYLLRRMLAELEHAGLLARRGRLVRVSPDVLADHLLYKAAVDANGTSTGFVDVMIKLFKVTSLENILANAAELDWRGARTRQHNPVLSSTWRDLHAALPNATYAERAELLKSTKRAALFAPEEVLRLAEWMADNPTAPPDQRLLGWGIPDKDRAVVDALAAMFSFVAGHRDFTDRCLARLWPIAAGDNTSTTSSEHPRRRVERLLQYEREYFWRPDDGVQAKAIRCLTKILLDPNRKGDASWAVTSLAKALGRIGENSKSTRRQITMSSFSLAPFVDTLSGRREEVLACLTSLALGHRPAEAGTAVHCIGAALQVPWGSWGLVLSSTDLAAWVPEAQAAVAALRQIATSAPIDVVRFVARGELQARARVNWSDVSPIVKAAAAGAPATQNERLYDVLVGAPNPDLDPATYDQQQEEARVNVRFDEAAIDLWQRHQTPEEVVATILEGMAALEPVAKPHGAQRTIRSVVLARPDRSEEAVRVLIASESRALGLLQPALAALDECNSDVAQSVILELTSAGDDVLRAIALDAMHGLLLRGRDVQPFLGALERLSQDGSERVRIAVPQVLRRFKKDAHDTALELLVGIEWGSELGVGEAVLDALHPEYGLNPARLTDLQIDRVLKRIRDLRHLESQAHDVLHFVAFASDRRPKQTVEMLLDRIHDRHQEPIASREERRTPLPYNGHGLSLPGIEKAKDNVNLIRSIRDATLGGGADELFWVPELFSLAAGVDSALSSLREWIASKEPEKLVCAARLLRGYGYGLIFSAHEFVADLLDAAAATGSDCLQDAKSELHSLATSGVYTGPAGEPMPRHLEQKSEGARLSELYTRRGPAREFYRELVKSAEDSIQRHQQDWDEEGDE